MGFRGEKHQNETKRYDGRKGTCREEGVVIDVGGRLERAEGYRYHNALYSHRKPSIKKLN